MNAGFFVGWRQVAIGFLLLSAAGMIASTYSIVAVPLAKEFEPSRMVLMLTMTIMSGIGALLSPFFGNLMDRTSLRVLMPLGGLCLAAGYVGISLATTFDQVLIVFAVLIAPANILIGPVAVTVLLSRWFARQRGRALGIAIAGIAAGGFVFPMIIQGLLDANQWRDALRLLGLVILLWTVPAALLVIDRPSDRGLNPDGDAQPNELTRAEAAFAPISVREILKDPAFWMICVTVAVVTSGMKGMVTNLAPLAIDNGVTATDAATLISIYAGCGFLAKINFAMLADRVGPRVLMFAALGGFGCGMALLTQASGGYYSIALGVAVIGLFGGLMVPIESYLAPRVFGQRIVGRALGLIAGVILIALLSTPPLFGLIFDVTGSYRGIFYAFAGLAFAVMLGVPYIRLHPRETARNDVLASHPAE
jgi:MFS family permease